MLMWGSAKTKKDGLVAAPVEGVFLMLEQLVGCFVVAVALAKLAVVFTHTQESTFLRRNLLCVFGFTDVVTAFFMSQHNAFLKETYGADALPFVLVLAAEGVSFLMDALLRERKPKGKKA